jgi:hypothetical protein
MLHRTVKHSEMTVVLSWMLDGGDLRDFQNLKVWTKAHEFVLGLYKVTAEFPQAEILRYNQTA